MDDKKLAYYQRQLKAGVPYRFDLSGRGATTIGAETITEVDSELLFSIDISRSVIVDGPTGMIIYGPTKLSLF